MILEHTVLNTIAGIAVALVGFSALLDAIAKKESIEHSTIRFELMIEAGLVTLFFCFFPLVPASVGVCDENVWRFSSMAIATYLIFVGLRGVIDLNKIRKSHGLNGWCETINKDDAPAMFKTSVTLGAITSLYQFMNVYWGEFNSYLLGVLFLLFWTGLLFYASFLSNRNEKQNNA
jgi:hypothetical protein